LNDGASCQADGVRLAQGTTSVSFDEWTWGGSSGVSWEIFIKIHSYQYVRTLLLLVFFFSVVYEQWP
jgi:hypothetical protein